MPLASLTCDMSPLTGHAILNSIIGRATGWLVGQTSWLAPITTGAGKRLALCATRSADRGTPWESALQSGASVAPVLRTCQ